MKHVQRALNRGEAYHQLRRAVSSVNKGISSGAVQTKKSSYGN